MKKLFVIACLPSMLMAGDDQRFEYFLQAPQAIANFMPDLMEQNKSTPSETIVVCDLDGVLTTNHEGDSVRPQARKNMPEFLKALTQSGFKVIIASAWHSFDETMKKINHLGLDDVFLTGERKKDSLTVGETVVFYEQKGLNVSCKNTESEIWFWNKAFAPYVAFGKDVAEQAKWVLFLDDTPNNIKQFQTDVTTYNLFPQVNKVTLFQLNHNYRMDCPLKIEEFQKTFPPIVQQNVIKEETADDSVVSLMKRSSSPCALPIPKKQCLSDSRCSDEELRVSGNFLRTSQASLNVSG